MFDIKIYMLTLPKRFHLLSFGQSCLLYLQVAKTSQGLFPRSFWISEIKNDFVDANIQIKSIIPIDIIDLF